MKLILEDDRVYAEEGVLQAADLTVNTTTNSVTVRAVFPNPRGELLPGMFVRARLEEGNSPDAILVPQNVVTRNTKGEPTTLVVSPQNTAEVRVLKTPRAVGNQWLVTSGLKPGNQVIVDNLQRVRSGTPVKPAPVAPPAPPTAAVPRRAADRADRTVRPPASSAFPHSSNDAATGRRGKEV